MKSLLLLFSLFSTTALEVVLDSSFCPTILLNHSSHYNGHYWLDHNSKCHSRKSWVRDDGSLHLYYFFDSHDGWVISTNDCETWGGFVAKIKSPELQPSQVQGSWTEFYEGSVSHSNITMRCLWKPSEVYLKSCLKRGCAQRQKCVHNGDKGFECAFTSKKPNIDKSNYSYNLTLLLFGIFMTLILFLTIAIMVRLCRGGRRRTESFRGPYHGLQAVLNSTTPAKTGSYSRLVTT